MMRIYLLIYLVVSDIFPIFASDMGETPPPLLSYGTEIWKILDIERKALLIYLSIMKKAKVDIRLTLHDLTTMRREWDELLEDQRFVKRLQAKVDF